MLAILLEHDNLRSARRAVLTSSFITLALPQIQVGGNGLEILGLVLKLSKESLLQTAWLVNAYFFTIFSGFVAARLISASKSRLQSRYGQIVERSQQKAREIDGEFVENAEPCYEDLDHWWKQHYDIEQLMTRRTSLVESVSQLALTTLSAFIEFGAAMIISACAVFVPSTTSELLFIGLL